MATKDNRDWTVIVMRPGQETRSFAVGKLRRTGFGLLMLVCPFAILALGHHLGTEGTLVRAATTLSASLGMQPEPDPFAQQEPPAGHARDVPAARAEHEPGPDAEAADASADAASAHMEQGDVDPAPKAQGDISDDTDMSDDGEVDSALSLQLDNGVGEVLEIRPFNADGHPLRAAFGQIRDLMACGDGRNVLPNARLVRLLVDAHQRFETPVRIMGGHCGAHDDRLEATVHHAEGRAVDVMLKGVSTGRLTEWLDELEESKPNGIGRYARKGFVHIDLRPGDPVEWEPDSESKAQTSRPPSKAKSSPSAAEPTSITASGEPRDTAKKDQATEIDAPKRESGGGPNSIKETPAATHAKQPGSGPTAAMPSVEADR